MIFFEIEIIELYCCFTVHSTFSIYFIESFFSSLKFRKDLIFSCIILNFILEKIDDDFEIDSVVFFVDERLSKTVNEIAVMTTDDELSSIEKSSTEDEFAESMKNLNDSKNNFEKDRFLLANVCLANEDVALCLDFDVSCFSEFESECSDLFFCLF